MNNSIDVKIEFKCMINRDTKVADMSYFGNWIIIKEILMVIFYVADCYNIAFAVRNFHLPNSRPVMYEIELRLKIVWAVMRKIGYIGIKFQVICKKFCLDFRIEMVGDIIDEQVEKKWSKTTATLRNAASDRASV